MLFARQTAHTQTVQTQPETSSPPQHGTRTTDTGKIRLGGGFRLPAAVIRNDRIRLGGGFRLPVRNA